MQKIISEMESFGLSVFEPIADGKIHRCRSKAKDKHNRDGWYSIHAHGGQYYAFFGCWVRDEKRKASTASGSGSSVADDVWKRIEQQQHAESLERLKKAKLTTAVFLGRWTSPAEPDHPYLLAKGVGVWGDLRQSKNALIVPVLDTSGDPTSYQVITGAGRKRFLFQGIVAGGCFPIHGDDALICICEGYATGATIREATGCKVLVAFNSGNMFAVAKAAVKKFPNRELLICADNDFKTEANRGYNPGIQAAKKIKHVLGIRYVFPAFDGSDGSDFNDLADLRGLDHVRQAIIARETIQVMSREECSRVMDDSLVIPKSLVLDGLIGEGLDALEGDILQYSLPLVLTAISRAIAGKISLNGVWPNVFNIKVGGTSTGKTAVDKRLMTCMSIPEFVSMNDIASGAGIWRAVEENKTGMGLFDEVSSLFIRHNSKGGTDITAEQKSTALCDLFSRSGQCFSKRYGDKSNNVLIQFPCVSIIGNATPTIFDAIQLRDFETGLMQRFDFWFYGGPILQKPLQIGSGYMAKTRAWVEELRKLMTVGPAVETVGNLVSGNIDLEASVSAVKAMQDFSYAVVLAANQSSSDGQVGFISRRFDLALKYALIHHASAMRAERVLSPVSNADVMWGIQVSEMLSGWKIDKLEKRVVSGDFHRDCETFKGAILAAVKSGRAPTFRFMASRRARLKDWQLKYAEQVIGVLRKRGEIVTKDGRDGVTLYYLPQNTDET